MAHEEEFEKWWKESKMANCYSSSQAVRRFKAAFIAALAIGRKQGIEEAAEVARTFIPHTCIIRNGMYDGREDAAKAIMALKDKV